MSEENKRDSFLIYRSFIEAGRGIESKKDRLSFYEAIFDFALENKINDLQGSAKGMFILVKPQLEANRKKYDNGMKAKQNGSKTEAKKKQGESKQVTNVNDNVNENVNQNENDNSNEEEAIPRAQISSQHQKDYNLLSIDECRKRYDLENVEKRNKLGMNLRITPDQAVILQNAFDNHLKSIDDSKSFSDYSRHFVNWANKLSPDELKTKIRPLSAINGTRIVHHV